MTRRSSTSITSPGIAKLLQRDYVKPGTERGPAPSLILEPKMLVLQRPQ